MLACMYSTDVTRSQTGDTDWEHKPKSLHLGQKESYAQDATISSWHYAIDYDIIDNIRKQASVKIDWFLRVNSTKR